jgi:hypothetical protein
MAVESLLAGIAAKSLERTAGFKLVVGQQYFASKYLDRK